MTALSTEDRVILLEEQLRLVQEELDQTREELRLVLAACRFAEARLAWLHRNMIGGRG